MVILFVCAFGANFITSGIHMTAYVSSPSSSYGMKLWIPRRAAGKQTYGGMLDNTVAGGMATGEDPFECLVRESDEEASLPEALVREKSQAKGTITYVYVRENRAGGESGMIQPECKSCNAYFAPSQVTILRGNSTRSKH